MIHPEFYEMAKEILKTLDKTIYPETYDELEEYIYALDNGEDDFRESFESFAPYAPYALACRLTECDVRRAMQRDVFDFIAALYQWEIGEGNPYAMNDLGALYYTGHGCEQNFEKAMHYYEMAAERGNTQAKENLGYCYYYGRCGEPDYLKAFMCFVPGAIAGRIVSMYKLGDMYKNGYAVEKNEAISFSIYAQCEKKLEDKYEYERKKSGGQVYLRLGNAYLYGIGTETDAEKALEYYQKAELYLFGLVKNGDNMYKGSLDAAIAGQSAAREKLNADLADERFTGAE